MNDEGEMEAFCKYRVGRDWYAYVSVGQ